MDKVFISQSAWIALLLATICLAPCACEKRSSAVPNASLPEDQSRPSVEIRPTPGTIEPAIIGREQGSFANYIHFPKEAAAQTDAAIQFYCDVSEEGSVETTFALVGNQDAFKKAVQSALDWGRFTPARVDGTARPVYLGGTVLFLHQGGQPVIVISLASAERDRIGKLSNYIQPQLIGGLRRSLEEAESNATINLPNNGAAEVSVKVNERGQIASSSVASENPKEMGLGEFLIGALKNAQFTPAYSNGKATAGEINVVANFAEF